MNFNIPKNVTEVLCMLQNSGYEAYIVGGCVRDLLLGKEPNDYDITTNAIPSQIKKVFSNYQIINNNGEKHGTVTVRYNKENIEITTYRIDSNYEDHRHPNDIIFTSSLKEDLSRRDFTINAIAYDGKQIIDYFGGISDLNDRIINAVGNAEKRFEEDALRILRGIRFACVLDFDISYPTKEAMLSKKEDLSFISKERIQSELNKMICYPKFSDLMLYTPLREILFQIIPFLKKTYLFNQKNKYHPHDLFEHSMFVHKLVCLNKLTDLNDYQVKLAAILHDIGKVVSFQEYINENGIIQHHYDGHPQKSCEIALDILNDLKYSNQDKELITWLIKHHDFDFSLTNPKRTLKKLLNSLPDNLSEKEEEKYIKDFCILRQADKDDHIGMIAYDKKLEKQSGKLYVHSEEVLLLYQELKKEKDCFKLKDLKVNGYDLINMGFNGKEIGMILNLLLNKVINEEIKNEKKLLLEFVKNGSDNK